MEESNPHGLNYFVLMLSLGEQAYRTWWGVAQVGRRGKVEEGGLLHPAGTCSCRGQSSTRNNPCPVGSPACPKRGKAWSGLSLWAGGRGRREDGVVVTAGSFSGEMALNSSSNLEVLHYCSSSKVLIFFFSLFGIVVTLWQAKESDPSAHQQK